MCPWLPRFWQFSKITFVDFTNTWIFSHICNFTFKIFYCLLGWHWLIILYRFQTYNSIIHHLYIVLYVHHPKSSLLPSPFIPLYPLLFLPTPLPSGNHRTVVWVYKGFFLLSPSPFSPSPLKLTVCSLYLWTCFYFVSLFCSLNSTYQWNHMVFVFLWLAYFT